MQLIGCDLGGTNLRAGIVNLKTGQVKHLQTTPTLAREGHDAVMGRMGGLIEKVVAESGLSKSDIGCIGIGVPGVLDLDRGLTLFLPNLSRYLARGSPTRHHFGSTGIPTAIINDVRSITFGEWCFGAGKGVETMACFAIGTGVGGGLVINGQLHLGIGGTGGELGHQSINFNGPICGCGNRGCLEAYASGPAIAANGMKAVVQGRTTIIGELVDFDLNKITPMSLPKRPNKEMKSPKRSSLMQDFSSESRLPMSVLRLDRDESSLLAEYLKSANASWRPFAEPSGSE